MFIAGCVLLILISGIESAYKYYKRNVDNEISWIKLTAIIAFVFADAILMYVLFNWSTNSSLRFAILFACTTFILHTFNFIRTGEIIKLKLSWKIVIVFILVFLLFNVAISYFIQQMFLPSS